MSKYHRSGARRQIFGSSPAFSLRAPGIQSESGDALADSNPLSAEPDKARRHGRETVSLCDGFVTGKRFTVVETV
jgi:hypothetical protein